jgi:hypothetical protein
MREERILFLNIRDVQALQRGLPLVLAFGTERVTLQYERTPGAARMARLKVQRTAESNGRPAPAKKQQRFSRAGLAAVRRNAKLARAALAAKRKNGGGA